MTNMGWFTYLTLTANDMSGAVQVSCGDVINFVCRGYGSTGDSIVLYKGNAQDRILASSRTPLVLRYKVSDASSSDTAWYTCHDETVAGKDDKVYVKVNTCFDTDVPNPIILWSCLAVIILVIAILASLISYFRMMKRTRARSTRSSDFQASATGARQSTVSNSRASDHFNLSLPTVSTGDVRQSRWSAVSSRMTGTPPYRSLRDYDADPPSYGSVVPEDDFSAAAADSTSAAHAPPPYSSVVAEPSQGGGHGKFDNSAHNISLDPPPAYTGPH